MRFGDVLAAEWRPALGCTEPASIAYAASAAAALADGPVRAVRLVCDPRMYKNCYAVGVPHSGGRAGLRWALALGAVLPDASLKLECFRALTSALVADAARLVEGGLLEVTIDGSREELFVDVTVEREGGTGRAIIAGEHTRIVRLERDGADRPVPDHAEGEAADPEPVRRALAALSFDELLELAAGVAPHDRAALRHGIALNRAIAEHGLGLFPDDFRSGGADAGLAGRAGRLVCAGVHARMSGEDFTVMTLAGSGNKGITVAVPLALAGAERALPEERVDEALAVAVLVTSLTTHHLGTLSAMCGGANAAGMGLAAGLVRLDGGGAAAMSLAVNNIVGNLAGMVCDGAKIGCGLKTMTAVDAAFRAAGLAMSGVGIPATDGIVGADGRASLANLGRLAAQGMTATDTEILRIMQEKLA